MGFEIIYPPVIYKDYLNIERRKKEKKHSCENKGNCWPNGATS